MAWTFHSRASIALLRDPRRGAARRRCPTVSGPRGWLRDDVGRDVAAARGRITRRRHLAPSLSLSLSPCPRRARARTRSADPETRARTLGKTPAAANGQRKHVGENVGERRRIARSDAARRTRPSRTTGRACVPAPRTAVARGPGPGPYAPRGATEAPE